MGLFGLEQGSTLKAPEWVNLRRYPGYTPFPRDVYGSMQAAARQVMTLGFFFYSPNLVWFFITVAMYVVFPYNLEAAKTWQTGWVMERFVINAALVVAFYGYWSITMYVLRWGKRKFKPDNLLTKARMIHNFIYCFAGVVQYTLIEAIFMHLWATGKLSYVKDSEVFSSVGSGVNFVFFVLAIPLLREAHFYFAHRFLHIQSIYKFVHSLHHRNADIEPFSGITMHPVEHLYYFSNVGFTLYFSSSPFHFLWVAIHLLISPAASHSGWEDQWGSDQFHYIHHAKFNVNFGGGGIPFDYVCGTYRATLGNWDDKDLQSPEKAYVPAKEGLYRAKPEPEIADFVPKRIDFCYYVLNFLNALILVFAVRDENSFFASHHRVTSFLVAVGPLLSAMFLFQFTLDKNKPWSYPFHKDSQLSLQPHIWVAFLFCCVPIYHTVELLLS